MIQEEKRDHRKEENDPYKIKKKPKPFAPESSLMYYMTKAGWVIILNIVFLISCLPVFTIGTAVTSFYYAMMKSIRRDRSYPLLEYWSSFKRTFVKGSMVTVGTGIWISLIWYLWNISAVSGEETGLFLQKFYTGLLVVTGAILIYLFPVMSRFTMKLSSMVKLSFVMAVRFLPYTAILLAGLLLLVFVWFRYLPIPMIFVWPGAFCFAGTFLMEKALRKYMPAPAPGEDAWYYE
jgi:uncharacterized membrane protein YesL